MSHQRYISEFFSAAENRCRCGECDRYSADVELVGVMKRLRLHYSVPIIVHSWFRCRAHNNRPKTEVNSLGVPGAGSTDGSWHLYGAAVDFRVQGKAPEEVAGLLKRWFPEKFGIGLYDWGVHLDVGPKRRWNG